MSKQARAEIPNPAGLRAELFEEGGRKFAILEFPIARAAPRPALPPAEEAVLALLLEGHSNAEIARRRSRSVRTVAHQVEAVFRRLGVGSRLELFALLCGGEEP